MGFLFNCVTRIGSHIFRILSEKFLVNRDFKMGRFAVKKLLPY